MSSLPDQSKEYDEEAVSKLGKGIYFCLWAGIMLNRLFPPASLVCIIAAIVMASIATCGCGAKYKNIPPEKKKWATATLVSLCLMFISLIVLAVSLNEYSQSSYGDDDDAFNAMMASLIISYILNILALIFAGIFAGLCGRCGAETSESSPTTETGTTETGPDSSVSGAYPTHLAGSAATPNSQVAESTA